MVWPILKRLDHLKTVQVCNWSVTYICLQFNLHRHMCILFAVGIMCTLFLLMGLKRVMRYHGSLRNSSLWGIC